MTVFCVLFYRAETHIKGTVAQNIYCFPENENGISKNTLEDFFWSH